MSGNWSLLVAAGVVGLVLIGLLAAVTAMAYRRQHPAREWVATAAMMLGIPLLAVPVFVALLWFGVLNVPALTGETRPGGPGEVPLTAEENARTQAIVSGRPADSPDSPSAAAPAPPG
jgi:hypothetical protein